MAQIVELIKVDITRGSGDGTDPWRIVTQYWSKEGELIFEIDALNK